MKLFLASVLICSSILSLAQSSYQSTAGYRPPRPQTVDTTTVRGEKSLSATEVYMLKQYYRKEIAQKEAALEQSHREGKRLQVNVSNLTDLNQELSLVISQLRDSVNTLRQQNKVIATVSTMPASSATSTVLTNTPKVTYTAYDTENTQHSATTTSGGGYMYSEISPRRVTPTVRRTSRSQQVYQLGPRGGCFYYTGSGRKEYVDRSLCH